MADTFRIENLDKLALVWLAVPRKTPTLPALGRALAPFLRGTGASPQSVARQCLARIKTRGDIEADTTWMLSPAGKEKALSTLGVASLPRRTSWKWVYTLLVARGNGTELSPAALRRVALAEGLALDVLQKQHRIQNDTALSRAQLGNALAWRELGIESTQPFTVKAVLATIVQKVCPGAPSPKDPSTALRMLAAAALNVSRGDTALRTALVQRWMQEPRTTQPPETQTTAAPDEPAALSAFAERVLVAARTAPTGQWGDHKVFIAQVWNEYSRRDPASAMDLDAFKRLLVRANQASLLSLSRADLVEAMAAEDVRRSEISSLGTTFHFIRTG